jgi:RNA polymerase sigma-70 factor (ECF subfamily)
MSTNDRTAEERFRAWLEAFPALLFKVVHSFTRTPQDEQELLQEILVQLWQSAARFDGRCAESTWVYRVAFYTAMAWRRTETRRQSRQAPAVAWKTLAAPEHAEAGRIEELYAAIRQLAKPAAALILMHLDSLSYREIGEVLGISEINVGTKLTRARARLGQIMKGPDHER